MNIRKIFKYILGLIGALFLGALGNGVWEKLLEPAFHITGTWIIELMSYIFHSYKDNIYKKASDGFHELPSLLLLVMFIALLAGLYQAVIKKHPYVRDTKSQKCSAIAEFIRSKKGYYVTYFISILATTFLYIFIVEYAYVNLVVTYSEKSINIVNPYIVENERLVLKSEFAKIKNAGEFYLFKEHLEMIAKANNVALDEFKPF